MDDDPILAAIDAALAEKQLGMFGQPSDSDRVRALAVFIAKYSAGFAVLTPEDKESSQPTRRSPREWSAAKA